MSSSSGSVDQQKVDVLFEAPEDVSSEEPSMSEWSSLELVLMKQGENVKKALFSEGLYSPGSGQICSKYIPQSDSTVLRHPYYNYPPVTDPGIKDALLRPEEPIIYPDDGQALYLHVCSEMNQSPVRKFHKNLLNSEICLNYYCVDPKGVRPMAMALEFNKYVKVLNLTDSFLSDDSCFHLGEMLKRNVTLKELNLSGCRIGESGLRNLGQYLHLNTTLETLNLSNCRLGDDGGAHFAKIIADGSTVKYVNLSKNEMGRETALALMEVFEYRDNIKVFDISWNNFVNVSSAVKMLNGISNSTVLEELYLSFNSFEGERIANAIYGLLLMPSLKVLDLSNNKLTGSAITIITPGLLLAKKLLIFDLSYNPMTPDDAYVTLSKMLRPKAKLRTLVMKSISVEKAFLTLLAKVSQMKSRKRFKAIYGDVLRNWVATGPDPRTVALRRAEYLGKANKKRRIDVLLYFLIVCQQVTIPVMPKEFIQKLKEDGIPLTPDFVNYLADVFPGPKVGKTPTINMSEICECVNRLWPDKKAPEPKPLPEPQQGTPSAKPTAADKGKTKAKK